MQLHDNKIVSVQQKSNKILNSHIKTSYALLSIFTDSNKRILNDS